MRYVFSFVQREIIKKEEKEGKNFAKSSYVISAYLYAVMKLQDTVQKIFLGAAAMAWFLKMFPPALSRRKKEKRRQRPTNCVFKIPLICLRDYFVRKTNDPVLKQRNESASVIVEQLT